MRLALMNWPPLASHALCLLLGALTAPGQPAKEERALHLARGRVLLALSPTVLAQARWPKIRPIPAGLAQLDKQQQGPLCRLHPEFLRLRQLEPFPILDIPHGQLAAVQGLLGRASAGKVRQRLFPLAPLAGLPLCRSSLFKVSYGSHP